MGVWRLATGAAWRDRLERYGPWQTADHRLNARRASGATDRLVERLRLRLDAAGQTDHGLYRVDGSNVRAARAAGGGQPARRAGRPTTL